MTRSALGALVAGATALVLTGCGATVVGGASGDLPVLHVGTRSAAAAKDASAGGASGADRYPLVGTLPTSPSSAPVHRFGTEPVPGAAVTALAASLGLSGSAVRQAHGVEVSGAAGTLRVRDGGAWSFWRADDLCPPLRVDVQADDPGSVAVGCAISEPGSSPRPAASTDPGTIADPVLDAAGIGTASARVVDGGAWSDVVVPPVVGGAPVVGLDTVVRVDVQGVRAAYGTLGVPAEGPAYPLISAADALDALRSSPVPELAIACAIGEVCPGIGPQNVTGAALGLMAAYDSGEQVLVPAWLFAIEGSDVPVAVVAVADRYLADPEPVGGSDGSGGSAVPPGSAEPGSPGTGATDPGLAPEPAPTASDLPLNAYTVSSYAVSADGRTLTLRTEGGICTDYAGEATETADRVTVTITGTPTIGPDQACPAVAKQVEETVVLAAPLGDRAVVDLRTGEPVTRA